MFHVYEQLTLRRFEMNWTAPKTKEVACGMEINMYASGEDKS
tara:strand:+ start:37 stop:162 length:126 start_codon:yes stop_codon:yes gene_type:complete